MAEDIKTTLYALLGKKKLGCPTYDCKEERRGKITRFKCELRVPNMNYVGLGCSTNKKNAMSNAARDFGMFMIREHLCVASELPNILAYKALFIYGKIFHPKIILRKMILK
jgi:hypothetical protein